MRAPLIVTLFACAGALALFAVPAMTAESSVPPQEPAWQKSASGLEMQDLKAGEGAEARAGATLDVQYTGWLLDGTKFDSSRDRGRPFSFRLGQGQVIRGWDEGFAGMKVGGVRKLRIPPELGYGSRGAAGVIPANATLLFEVELVAVR